ncbi:MAG: redox-regulated ATPase YchF [Candidatus Pacearchaeota archaeon]
MLIGLVGKPSCGKSTFFKAATLMDVLIAPYPFATIKPNNGIAYVRVKCICNELGVKCTPRTGSCDGETRFVPVELMDVAGLIEGASEGKGLGNQFLNDLSLADALIQIVDVSGTTDDEGREGQGNPIKDVRMLEKELDLWFFGILNKAWNVFARKIQTEKSDFVKAVAKQFSGINVKEENVERAMKKLKFDIENPEKWSSEQLKEFAHELRVMTKPMLIAANKIDKPGAEEWFYKLKKEFPSYTIIPCSADAELSLRQAVKAGLIKYKPGDKNFEVVGDLNERQKQALEFIRKNVLEKYNGTGVQEILDFVVFSLLNYIAVFPAGVHKLADSQGRILPDCFLVPQGTTALDFAYKIHTDLGKNFIKAIDARTKQAVGKEHILKHRDGIEIVSSK